MPTRSGAAEALGGVGIGILALVVLGIQSFLTWLAFSRGRIPLDMPSIARFLFFTLAVSTVLAVSSFVSYVESKKPNKAPEPTPTSVTPPAAQESRRP